jgi:hypothetical protein
MPESFLYFETFFVELEEIVRDLCGKIVEKELNGLLIDYIKDYVKKITVQNIGR